MTRVALNSNYAHVASNAQRPVALAMRAMAMPVAVALCLSALTVAASFSGTESAFDSLGKAAIIGTLALPTLVFIYAMLSGAARFGASLTWSVAWIVFTATLWPRTPFAMTELADWAPLIQAVLIGQFFVSASGLVWPTGALTGVTVSAAVWCGCLAGYLVVFRPEMPYQAYFINPNPLGAEAGLLASVGLLGCIGAKTLWRRVSVISIIGCALLIVVASQSRSALVSIIAGGGVWFAWSTITRTRWRHTATFTTGCFAIFMFVVGQTLVVEWLTDSGWQDWSRAVTGKNVGTRVIIWRHMLDAIAEKPWLGHGPTASPADVLGRDLSAHNLYLQVTFQSGVVGCASLVVALAMIWRRMWQGRCDPIIRLASAVMIGVIVHQSFEVTLTQNHLALGCPAWLIMAIGISRSGTIMQSSAARPTHKPHRRSPSNHLIHQGRPLYRNASARSHRTTTSIQAES